MERNPNPGQGGGQGPSKRGRENPEDEDRITRRGRYDDDYDNGNAQAGPSSSRGRGRGRSERGRGGGRGRGGARGPARPVPPPRPPEVEFDLVNSRPAGFDKKGATPPGQELSLITNYFEVQLPKNWTLYQHRVDFEPDLEDNMGLKVSLVRPHRPTLGTYIFDGSMLYTKSRFKEDPLILWGSRRNQTETIKITIKFTNELPRGDIQFFNLLMRECLRKMQFEPLGRGFYDNHHAINIPNHGLTLMPGVLTSIRQHEHKVLLNIELTHKVLRNDTVLELMKSIGLNQRERIRDELVNTIVLTSYLRNTYKVDDIDWDSSPLSTFKCKGETLSFAEYYRRTYGIEVRDLNQPLLVSRPKKMAFHHGKTRPQRLLPELCMPTGLTNDNRKNFNLMRDLAVHLQKPPAARVERLTTFMRELCMNQDARGELGNWGIGFNREMERIKGKQLLTESIKYSSGNLRKYEDGDWTSSLRNSRLFLPSELKRWIIIVPHKDSSGVDSFADMIQTVSNQLGFRVSKPLEIYKIPGSRIENYRKEIDTAVGTHKDLQLVFIVVPPNKPVDLYSAIKRRLCCEYSIPSQCVTSRNVNNQRGGMSIATKIAIQISAKIGGVPWSVENALSNTMVIGFDAYHSKNRTKPSVGAMVCTTNSNLGQFYSTASFHGGREQLSSSMCQDIKKCLSAYMTANKKLPDRILFYRDGVGDGCLTYVHGIELTQIKMAITEVYTKAEIKEPHFSFIVVTKKIKTRIMTERNPHANPKPGTVVDDYITLPERYDFFLISQDAKQGTVSPTSYNVIHHFDNAKVTPFMVQKLTYKLCHLYYNWSGTLSVPAVCQYAKKLAYLSGQCLESCNFEGLSNQLFYL